MTSPPEPAPIEWVTSVVRWFELGECLRRHALHLGGIRPGVFEPAEVLGEFERFVGRLPDDAKTPAPRGKPRYEPEMALHGKPFACEHLDHAKAPRRIHRIGPGRRRLDPGAQDVVRGRVRAHVKIGDGEGLRCAGAHGGYVRGRGAQDIDARGLAGCRLLSRPGTGLGEPGLALERDEIGHCEIAPGRLSAIGVDPRSFH